MGLSHLQGSPWHIVQIKRRIDEDNDPFFTKKRNRPHVAIQRKKAKNNYVSLKPGDTYLVTDTSSGLNNQKVIFEESVDHTNAKVKLGEKVFIVKKSSLSYIEPDNTTENSSKISSQHLFPENEENKVKVYKKKSRTETKSHNDPLIDNIIDKSSLPKKKKIRNQPPKVPVYLLNSSYSKFDAFLEKEVNNGFLIRLVNKNSGSIKIKFFPTKAVSIEKPQKQEIQTQKKTLVTIVKKKQKTILPKKIEEQGESLIKQDKIKKEDKQENKEIERHYILDINKYKFGSMARLLCVVRHEDSANILPIAYVNLKQIKTIFSEIKFNEIKTEELFPISSGADTIKLRKYVLFDFEISKKSGNSKKRYSLNYHEEVLISVNRQVPIYRIRLFDNNNINNLIESSLSFLSSKENDEPAAGFIAFSKNITANEVNSIYMPANGLSECLTEIGCFKLSEEDFIKIIIDGEEVLFYQKTSLPPVVKTINIEVIL